MTWDAQAHTECVCVGGVPAGGTSGWPGGQVTEEGAAAHVHADAGVRVRAEHRPFQTPPGGQRRRSGGQVLKPTLLSKVG